MSKFGQCQIDFSELPWLQKIVNYFMALPLPDLSKLSWVSTWMKESPTYFKFDKHLLYSEFNISASRWINLLRKALDSAGVSYTHEILKSGHYTNDIFIIDNQYALNIGPLRRGGRGILLVDMVHVEYMREHDKETRAKADAKKKVLDTLTNEQRRALGV